MTGILLMAIVTGIILITTFKFNGDYIQYTMVMYTAGLVIYQLTFHNNPIVGITHCRYALDDDPSFINRAVDLKKAANQFDCID